jgi:hypothetical protein
VLAAVVIVPAVGTWHPCFKQLLGWLVSTKEKHRVEEQNLLLELGEWPYFRRVSVFRKPVVPVGLIEAR